MRSGVLSTVAVLSILTLGHAKAQVDLPDLPAINEGPASSAPRDELYPNEMAPAPAPVQPAPVIGQETASPQALPPADPLPAALPAGPPLDVDRVMDRVKTCWTQIPRTNGTEAQGGIARIRIKFQANGLVDGQPMIIDKPLGAIGAKFAESAAEAIRKCQPYALPSERYAEWRQIEMRFDTIDPDNPPPPPPPAPAPPIGAAQPPAGPVQSGALPDLAPGDGYVPSVPAPGE